MNEKFINTIKWNEKGLLPVYNSTILNNEILMMAWVNKESLNLTIKQSMHTIFQGQDRKYGKKVKVQVIFNM